MAQRRPFPEGRLRGALAVDFANTVACNACGVGDALRGTREFERWLRAHSEVGVRSLSNRDLSRLRAFRLDLRATFRAAALRTRPPPRALGAVNRAARRFRMERVLRWRRGAWEVDELIPASNPLVRLAGQLSESTFAAIAGENPGLLRQCQGPRCAHFILARTRTQLWCSPSGCGNRARVARHYWRLRSRPQRLAPLARGAASRKP